jgi:hypothetical protein
MHIFSGTVTYAIINALIELLHARIGVSDVKIHEYSSELGDINIFPSKAEKWHFLLEGL